LHRSQKDKIVGNPSSNKVLLFSMRVESWKAFICKIKHNRMIPSTNQETGQGWIFQY